MAHDLHEHWSRIFGGDTHADPAATSRWIRRIAERTRLRPAEPRSKWIVQDSHLRTALKESNNSAPGPDGVPYRAWRILDEVAVIALREVVTSIVYDGRALQERDGSWFNESLLCCLPKSTSGTMEDGTDFYDASNTRPLSVGNTDCRLIAAACRAAWQPLFQARVDPHQRGFLPHRSMAANIYEVEEAMRTEACMGQDSAAIFWDWAAAFPSIDRGFLLAALRAQGLPQYAMALIEGLYTRTTCQVVHGGFRHDPFEAIRVSAKAVRSAPCCSYWLPANSLLACPRWQE
jgi:hypothetical protein